VGATLLTGIGFTMAIFVALLAFHEDATMINYSQIMVLLASLVAANTGASWFITMVPVKTHEAE